MEIQLIIILLIIFIATLTRATLGFGDALIAMPLLVLVIDLSVATPVVAFGSVVIAVTMLITNWKDVDFKSAWRLILASFIGIPIGLLLLKHAPEMLVKVVLGLILILFGGYNLFKPNLPRVESNFLAYISGFIAGILGGAYNCNGPPVIIYGKFAHWPQEKYKATLQCYFVPNAFMIMINHGISGFWTPQVLRTFAFALPGVVLALFIGTKLSKRIKPGVFDRYVYMMLILMGVLMFV